MKMVNRVANIFSIQAMLCSKVIFESLKEFSNADCSKTCLKWPLKKDKTKVEMVNGNVMKVESIAECSEGREHSAILLTCIMQ